MFARRTILVGSMVLGTVGAVAEGQMMQRAVRLVAGAGAAPRAGAVSIPHSFADNTGTQWMIQNYGQFQQQGNTPVYSQGAMLQIGGQYPRTNNQARIDEKTGELVMENMPVGNVSITRRILMNKEEGYIRYIDVFKNTTNQDQTVNMTYQTHTNYGVQMANMLADPKVKNQNIAWIAQTHANNRVVVEMYGGKNAKSVPTFNYQQGNNSIQLAYAPTIGGGKEIALMHFHYTTHSIDSGEKFVLNMKESAVMASIPPAIRKLIVNFRGGENFIGDYEILRGEVLDVVELRTGDQLRGNIKEPSFKLQAFYGAVELPIDKVIGMINAGEFRPRQLIVTKDGEVFGGTLNKEKITLELSSGQLTEIPISQISRFGYRKRAGEPEEWTFEKPIVLMRTGDRIAMRPLEKDISIATRYGLLLLKPTAVAAIDFQAEEHGVHQIYLTDGSKFAGLVQADAFEMKLAGEGPEQIVKFPASSIRRLQLTGKIDDPDEEQPSLGLANEDRMVGALVGALKLDTAFNTIALSAGEIKRMAHTEGSPTDVQVTLWDDTTVSGQLQEQEVTCRLNSGVEIRVPVALVQDYSQPRPQPSESVVTTIKSLVAELNAEDWKQRDAAQSKLASMGAVVVKTLKELRATQSPEAQQRIDLILKQADTAGKPAATTGAGVAPQPQPPMMVDE